MHFVRSIFLLNGIHTGKIVEKDLKISVNSEIGFRISNRKFLQNQLGITELEIIRGALYSLY